MRCTLRHLFARLTTAYQGSPWTCRCGATNDSNASHCAGCGAPWGATF